jgi:hypothetical protein
MGPAMGIEPRSAGQTRNFEHPGAVHAHDLLDVTPDDDDAKLELAKAGANQKSLIGTSELHTRDHFFCL